MGIGSPRESITVLHRTGHKAFDLVLLQDAGRYHLRWANELGWPTSWRSEEWAVRWAFGNVVWSKHPPRVAMARFVLDHFPEALVALVALEQL